METPGFSTQDGHGRELSERLRGRSQISLLAGALLLGLIGCQARNQTPEDTLKAFINDLRQHHGERAFQALSASSRAEILNQAESLSHATGEKPETDPAKLLFERMELLVLRSPESISVASPIGQEVTLRVSVEGGETATLRMVRERNCWKVDLSGSLESFAGYGVEPKAGEMPPPGTKTATRAESHAGHEPAVH